MNATGDLSRVADALERIRTNDLTAAAIARATGHATSTVSRDRVGVPLIEWSLGEGLQIGRACVPARKALVDFLMGEEPDLGDAQLLTSDLLTEVRASSLVAEQIRAAFADGALSAREIDDIRSALKRRTDADAKLMRDLADRRRTAKP